MVWGPGWRVRVQPVFSGAAVFKGTGTVTIEEWVGGPGRVSYEFPAAGLASIPPDVARQSDGLLRQDAVSGSVVVPVQLRSRAVFTPPARWPGGDAHAPGPLLWLPHDALASIRERGAAEVAVEPLPNGLRMRTEAGSGGPAKLTVAGSGEAVLRVNGTQTRFPIVRLEDEGGSTFTVLNSSQNPLVIRFRLGKNTSVGGRILPTGTQSGYDVVALDGPE
jgi:hypothetical protein